MDVNHNAGVGVETDNMLKKSTSEIFNGIRPNVSKKKRNNLNHTNSLVHEKSHLTTEPQNETTSLEREPMLPALLEKI